MALNPTPPGKAIADLFFNYAPTPGTPVTVSQLEALWESAIAILYADIVANMDVLPAGHAGPGLQTPIGIPGEVFTGAGAGGTTQTNAAETIIGMGSVQ